MRANKIVQYLNFCFQQHLLDCRCISDFQQLKFSIESKFNKKSQETGQKQFKELKSSLETQFNKNQKSPSPEGKFREKKTQIEQQILSSQKVSTQAEVHQLKSSIESRFSKRTESANCSNPQFFSKRKWDTVIGNVELNRAVNAAIQLLDRRDYSEKELTKKIESKEVQQHIAKQAVQIMVNKGIVNDFEYAKAWSIRWKSGNRGPQYAKQNLFKKGIPREIIENAIQTVYQSEDNLEESFQKLMLEVNRKFESLIQNFTVKEQQKLKNWLIRRGYDNKTVDKVLQSVRK